ncbi:LacI family DNA-binding transcriptional regulator [Gryllotalpicola ginsengisoli]|uniref:LacI family DNA-binding transcriptional regulator n=1 Tax=Gryllotalpicola ginsengisoli TaxID=444608 RepID=UPI000415608B|nr:LacI family DNA-binding transcriptional regulator [Gryllotalpicola ginsengisoli]
MTVSVRDVAEHAGVSVGTVSNVLNGKATVRPETVERVLAAVAELGFVRNDAARQLRAGVSRSIGMIVLDAGNPFFTGLARAAEQRALAEGRAVLLANSDEQPEREALYLDLFEQQRVAGLLISPVGDAMDRLHALHGRGTPTVLVDRFSDDPGFSSVSVDDVAGGRMAAAHLLETGRRRIAFVGGPRRLRQVADRLRGARQALRGRTDASLSVLPTRALTVDDGRRAASELLRLPASDRPDAVFAANDLLAIGVLQGVLEERRVPGELAIVGYDDIPFAASMAVPLTSVRQPYARMGERAVELLEREIADPSRADREHVVFEPELVVRASSGVREPPGA